MRREMLEGVQQHIIEVLVPLPESSIRVLLIAIINLFSVKMRDRATEKSRYHGRRGKETELLHTF